MTLSNPTVPDEPGPRTRLAYWEDIAGGTEHRFGPLSCSSALLDHLLDLLGERHPIHDDQSFAAANQRRGRVVPGGFIHSITSGWTVRHSSPAAIVGMRSMTWNFVRPLLVDTPFYFTTRPVQAQALDDGVGLVETLRRVVDENDRAYAIGRMSVVVLRRPVANVREETPG
jgi:acyl dehydratase